MATKEEKAKWDAVCDAYDAYAAAKAAVRKSARKRAEAVAAAADAVAVDVAHAAWGKYIKLIKEYENGK